MKKMGKILAVAIALLMLSAQFAATVSALWESPSKTGCQTSATIKKAANAVVHDGVIRLGEYEEIEINRDPSTTDLLLVYLATNQKTKAQQFLNNVHYYISWDETNGLNFAAQATLLETPYCIGTNPAPEDWPIHPDTGLPYPSDEHFMFQFGLVTKVGEVELSENEFLYRGIGVNTETGEQLYGWYKEHGLTGFLEQTAGEDYFVKVEGNTVTYEISYPFESVLEPDKLSGGLPIDGDQIRFVMTLTGGSEGKGLENAQTYGVSLGDGGFLGGSPAAFNKKYKKDGGKYTNALGTFSDDVIEIPLHDHDYEAQTVDPTCTEQGYTKYVCSICGDSYIDGNSYVNALGHDWSEWEQTAVPTCTEPGEETRTCSRCRLSETQPVNALGHDYVDVVTDPTCTEQGFTTHTCSRGDDEYVDTYVDALGHDWDEGTVTLDPTETEPGIRLFKCGRCDAEREEEIAPIGINQVKFDVENKLADLLCTAHEDVNFQFGTGSTFTEENINALLTEVFGYKAEIVSGYQSIKDSMGGAGNGDHCWAECEVTFTDEANDESYTATFDIVVRKDLYAKYSGAVETGALTWCRDERPDAVVAALEAVAPYDGTTLAVKPSEANADCVDAYFREITGFADANKYPFFCSEINADNALTEDGAEVYFAYKYVDPDEGRTYTVGANVFLKHGHEYTAVVTDPTCTGGGYTTYTCECGDTYTADETAALGHDYQAVVTDPTCTESGYTTHTCTRCKDSYTDSETAALGHDWDDGVVTVQPTIAKEGVRTFTCTRCGENGFESVPKVELKDSSGVFKDLKAQWYKQSVDYVYTYELMNGLSKDKFGPNEDMSRAMLVTVLWRSEGEPESSVKAPFTDLKADWYKSAVTWAYENSIVNGTSATTFSPNDPITREQIAAIMMRYAEFKGYDTTKTASLRSFPDNKDVHQYAQSAMQWAVAEGLISGVKVGDKNYLQPRGNASRAQVATILMRFLEAQKVDPMFDICDRIDFIMDVDDDGRLRVTFQTRSSVNFENFNNQIINAIGLDPEKYEVVVKDQDSVLEYWQEAHGGLDHAQTWASDPFEMALRNKNTGETTGFFEYKLHVTKDITDYIDQNTPQDFTAVVNGSAFESEDALNEAIAVQYREATDKDEYTNIKVKDYASVKAEYDAMAAAGETERTLAVPLTVIYTPHFNQAHFPDSEFDRTYTLTIKLG